MKVLLNKIIITTGLLIITALSSNAQQQFSVSYDELNDNANSFTYVIGSPYLYLSGPGGSLTSGPIIIGTLEVVSIFTGKLAEELSIAIYPNPTTDIVNIEFRDVSDETISGDLYTVHGQLLTRKELSTKENNTIDLTTLSGAYYFLKIYSSNKLIKTVKIIKK